MGESHDARPTGSWLARRGRGAAVAALALVGTGLVGVLVGATFGRQPEAQADALPPVTVTVEQKVLRDEVEITCQSRRAQVDLTLPPLPEDRRPVVTAVPGSTGALGNGAVLAEVEGRPFLLLDGAFPLYRDLRGGDTGPDVRAAQVALGKLGHYKGAPSGVFDDATSKALVSLYGKVGYPPPGGGASMMIRRSEIALVAGLPAEVSGARPSVGVLPGRRLARLSVGQPRVECEPGQAGDIRPGERARIGSDDDARWVVASSREGSGEVAAGSGSPGEDSAGSSPSESPAPPSGAGQVVTGETGPSGMVILRPASGAAATAPQGVFSARVEMASTDGPVTAVPVAALGGAGTDSFVRVYAGQDERKVSVRVKVILAGQAAVEGDLRPGEHVIVSGGRR